MKSVKFGKNYLTQSQARMFLIVGAVVVVIAIILMFAASRESDSKKKKNMQVVSYVLLALGIVLAGFGFFKHSSNPMNSGANIYYF